MPDANDGLISQPAQAKMPPEELKEARRKFEAGQTTRRAALRKIGITAGAAFFALFAVDDLARIAGKRLEQMQIDNKIADDLAKELRSVGVAFAATGNSSNNPCSAWEKTPHDDSQCGNCNDVNLTHCKAITGNTPAQCQQCYNNASGACGSQNYPQWTSAWQACGIE